MKLLPIANFRFPIETLSIGQNEIGNWKLAIENNLWIRFSKI